MAENPRLSNTRARAIARHVYHESLKRHVDYRLILEMDDRPSGSDEGRDGITRLFFTSHR